MQNSDLMTNQKKQIVEGILYTANFCWRFWCCTCSICLTVLLVHCHINLLLAEITKCDQFILCNIIRVKWDRGFGHKTGLTKQYVAAVWCEKGLRGYLITPQVAKTHKATCLQACFAPSLPLHMTQLHFHCATQNCLSVAPALPM